MRMTLREYAEKHSRPEILSEWHHTKNPGLSPDTVAYGGHQKIWWQCDKGHEWEAQVYTRTTAHSGCPYCGGKRVLVGENDFASQYPDLVKEWHPTKNGSLTPQQVSAGVHRKVWWKGACGHEWEAQVRSRTSGCGCPYCANKIIVPGQNDLGTTHPMLAEQWHKTKNGALTPKKVVSGSVRKVWWQCPEGHEWQATIHSRVVGAGCPVCAGKVVVPNENDLASQYPLVASQWHPSKNGTLKPEQVTPSSNRVVWWVDGLGHEWKAAVSARTAKGSGCPYCTNRRLLKGFNDLQTLVPKVAAQWHPTLNGKLTPDMVLAGSHNMAWWRCDANHVWKAVIYSRTQGKRPSGCPYCYGRPPKVKYPWHMDEILE